ncbi:MAG: nuclease-related domain-containing protein [Clostridium sp.]
MKYSIIDENKKIIFYVTLATIISTLLKAYIWYVPIYLLFVIYLLFKDNTYRNILSSFRIKRVGKEGEAKVASVLNELGFNKYIVMNDLNLKINDMESQIDHLVIGNNGIFNIETKNYSGIIDVSYNGNIYQRTSKGNTDVSGFITQVNLHYNTLNGIFNGDIPIYNLIVIANSKTNIINGDKGRVPIISINDLKDYLNTFKGEDKRIKKEKVYEIIESCSQSKFEILKKEWRYFLKNNKSTFKFATASLSMLLLLFLLNDGNIFKIIEVGGDSTKVANSFSGRKIQFDDSELELKIMDIEKKDLGMFLTIEEDSKINYENLKMYVVDINEEKTQGVLYGGTGNKDKVYLFPNINSFNSIYKIKISYTENGKTLRKEINPKEM